jgi:hypothetical protein
MSTPGKPKAIHTVGHSTRSVKDFVALPARGGLRRTTPRSVNLGWRNQSFRGYADCMQTDAFKAAVDDLIALASSAQTAIICADAVPGRRHRSLIADALIVRGVEALEIVNTTRTSPHTLTPFARVDSLNLTYAPERLPLEVEADRPKINSSYQPIPTTVLHPMRRLPIIRKRFHEPGSSCLV